MLDLLSFIENRLSLLLKPTDQFDRLFERIQPDLVFNCSHIHAPAAELPVRVAHQKGIRTAAFIFSWDNLSTRGRILPPYDDYFVWHEGMRQELLSLYPSIRPEHVFITGTPQFDFHFQPAFCMTREELCERLGLDPPRPYILYTTGMAEAFPEEYRFVETIIASAAGIRSGTAAAAGGAHVCQGDRRRDVEVVPTKNPGCCLPAGHVGRAVVHTPVR